ncbi:MAG: TonB-dependent receptor [Defluviicoccus sp.]|nr:TonB-dependent receptor [Defluviicoccus sp.]
MFVAVSPVGSAALAANGGAPEQAFFEELPVVLSVSRLPQSLADTPGALTVLDRETIRATGYRRLPDLLRLVPGFNVAWQRGWWGVVNYHGFSGELPNRLLVLVDGRPINSEYFSGAADLISQPLAIDDIERIEVLRGSNSAAFGTNAFLGVINIQTRHASQSGRFYAQVNHGEQGIRDTIVRAGGSTGPLDLRLTLGRTKEHGLDELVDQNHQDFANLRADLRLGEADEVTLHVGSQRGPAMEGFRAEPISNPVRERRTRNGFAQLRWRHVFSPESELSVQMYHNHDRYVDVIDLGFLRADLNRLATRDSVELQHFLRLTPHLRAVWGAEWRRDEVEAPSFLQDRSPARSHTERLFGNVEWRAVDNLSINIGAMAERVSITGTDVSPRVFANYEVVPGHVLRGGLSTATRAPTFYEAFAKPLFTSVSGNPDLDRERVLARELGYFGVFPSLKLQADVRLYREDLRDLIGTTEIPLAQRVNPFVTTTFANLEAARTRGISYQLKWSPFVSTQLALGQAFERISQRITALQESAPSHSTSIMWTQRLPADWSFTVMHYAVGAIHWQGFGDRVPAYRRTDARVSYAFRTAGLRGEASLVGLNMFDRNNEFRLGTPGESHVLSRRAYATLRLEF